MIETLPKKKETIGRTPEANIFKGQMPFSLYSV